jgi:FMN phosphatase YigB (HAD superfamily)
VIPLFDGLKKTVAGIFSTKEQPPEQHKDEVQEISDVVTQEQIVAEINEKLEQAEQDRVPYELQWELNTNFLLGNHYCDIDPFTRDMIQIDKAYWFQEREVFNQIAPIIETRQAKLSRVRPS